MKWRNLKNYTMNSHHLPPFGLYCFAKFYSPQIVLQIRESKHIHVLLLIHSTYIIFSEDIMHLLEGLFNTNCDPFPWLFWSHRGVHKRWAELQFNISMHVKKLSYQRDRQKWTFGLEYYFEINRKCEFYRCYYLMQMSQQSDWIVRSHRHLSWTYYFINVSTGQSFSCCQRQATLHML